MKILNFGSLNIDYVYGVESFVNAGETKAALSYMKNVGGKGLNQSVAMSRAGLQVFHAGKVGADGEFMVDYLAENGVNTDFIIKDSGESGHAIIQVDKFGQNCILINGGANTRLTHKEIDSVMSHFGEGDVLVLQNEINEIGYIIDKAYTAGMQIVFNVAPVRGIESEYPLEKVAIINVNESEGAALTGKTTPEDIIEVLSVRYPASSVLLTLGKDGSAFYLNGKTIRQGIFETKVVDTTSAGDTFFGYFLKEYLSSGNAAAAMELASRASAVCVSRKGASSSVPYCSEL